MEVAFCLKETRVHEFVIFLKELQTVNGLTIGDWGEPNREIGFGFVSCSCRACVRACEAVWVREGGVSQRWRLERQEIRLRRGFGGGTVCCYTRGF